MTAKEYLEQIKTLEHKIYCMRLRSDEYDRLSLSIPGGNFDNDMPHSPNRNTEAPFIKWIYKKMEIDQEIKKLEEELKNLKAEAFLKIESLENEDYKMVLIMRYIKGMAWDQIAVNMYISRRTAIRWHGLALESMNVGT